MDKMPTLKFKRKISSDSPRKRTQKETKEAISRFVDEGNPNTKNPSTPDQEQQVPGAVSIGTSEESPQPSVEDPSLEVSEEKDQHLVEEITTAIQKEDSISFEAKEGVEVIADGGIVTLYGAVPTKQEKMTIGDKATAFAGVGWVRNHLQVDEDTDEGGVEEPDEN